MRYSCEFGFFEIDSMPNQPLMALCHSFTVYEKNRGKGLGYKLKQYQHDVLEVNGFVSAVCTVRSTNIAEIKILNACGWYEVAKFFDNRNEVYIFVYQWVKR